MKIPDNHFMPREAEIFIGVIMFALGTYFLWLAFEARGKKMIWPFSGLMPI